MVDLRFRDFTFCRFFLRRETRKLMEVWVLTKISFSVCSTLPTATARQSTFLSWNLTCERMALTLFSSASLCVHSVGNLPALLRPGPRRRGICLITDSDARKASYFLANFLTSFLFLFNFFKSSTLMKGMPLSLASSQWAWSPKMHTVNLGRGTCFNLTVPEKRLSFWGS